jgi:hypothetical protein
LKQRCSHDDAPLDAETTESFDANQRDDARIGGAGRVPDDGSCAVFAIAPKPIRLAWRRI